MVLATIIPQAGSVKISIRTELEFEVCPAVGDTITMDDLRGDPITVSVVGRDFFAYNLRKNLQQITLTVVHD